MPHCTSSTRLSTEHVQTCLAPGLTGERPTGHHEFRRCDGRMLSKGQPSSPLGHDCVRPPGTVGPLPSFQVDPVSLQTSWTRVSGGRWEAMGGFHHSCWCWNAQEGHEEPRNEGTSGRRPGRGSRRPFTQASSVLRPRKLPSVHGGRTTVCVGVAGVLLLPRS